MASPWPTYALRLALAGTFILAGLDHAVSDGGMAWAVRWFPWPEPAGQALAWGELAIGLGLAAGALFALSAAGAAFVAAGATITVLVEDGNLAWQDPLMLGAALFVLASGPGPAALDAVIAARWPGLGRWLRPFPGEAAQRAGLRALHAGMAIGLLGIFAEGVARGQWTSPSGARLGAVVGLAYFLARPIAGVLVLAGAAPRVAGALLLLAGLINLALSPMDYHPYVPLALGAAWLAWPGVFAARPLLPLAAARRALAWRGTRVGPGQAAGGARRLRQPMYMATSAAGSTLSGRATWTGPRRSK